MPSNAYAFTGHVYLNPNDFEQIQTLGKARKIVKTFILVQAGSFILKAEPLQDIESGNFGASSFHREMLNVSKFDKVLIQLANVNELNNPLSEVNMTVDYKMLKRDERMVVEEDGTLLKLEEDMLAQELVKLFRNRFINAKEQFALPLYDSKLIVLCTIDKITPFNV